MSAITAQEFVDSHAFNVDLNVEGADYNLDTLYIIMPQVFSQRFHYDTINKEELGTIWVYEIDDGANGTPIAWWDCERVHGYAP